MPMLGGGFPVTDIPEVPNLLADSRTLAFRALDGTYPLPPTGKEFFFLPDCEGLDMPPREVITRRIPGMDGEQLRRIRITKRELFLPLWLSHDSEHAGYLDRRDALAGLFEYEGVDYQALGGTFDVVASSLRGERYVRCVYTEGMTQAKWPSEGSYWAKLPITAWAVQPHWRGDDWSTPIIQVPTAAAWFGTFPPQLSSSQAIGSAIPVAVTGDVRTWATVDLVGPATSVSITAPGLSVSIPAGLGSAEEVQITTNPLGRDAVFDGATDWTRVAPNRTFAALKPGVNAMSIVMAGADAVSQARVWGPSLYRRPW